MTTLYVTYHHVECDIKETPKGTVGFLNTEDYTIEVGTEETKNTYDVTPSFNINYDVQVTDKLYRRAGNLEWSGMSDMEKELRTYLDKLAHKIRTENKIKGIQYTVNKPPVRDTEELLDSNAEETLKKEEKTADVENIGTINYTKVREDIEYTMEQHKEESAKVRKEKAKQNFKDKKEEVKKQEEDTFDFW